MPGHQSSFQPVKLSQLSIGLFQKQQTLESETVCQKREDYPLDLTLSEWQANYRLYSSKDHYDDFLNESIIASLLIDLHQSLSGTIQKTTEKANVPWYKQALFYWLIGAGSFLAITEGIDGMASMLSLLPSFSPIWLVIGGGLFSVLSLSVFYGFDMISISENLGIESNKTPDLLDQYILQIEKMEQITNYWLLHAHEIDEQSLLVEIDGIRDAFEERLTSLRQAGSNYESALQNMGLYCFKKVFSTLTALFYFSGGFFGGQSLAMTLLSLGGVTATALSPPVLLTSVFLGVAAMSIFWFFERPGVENLVGQWVGLDQDKIEQLSSETTINHIESQLNLLKAKIEKQSELVAFRSQSQQTVEKNLAKTSCLGIFASHSSNDDSAATIESDCIKDPTPALQMG